MPPPRRSQIDLNLALKYSALSKKYAQLVDRSRADRESVLSRLGYHALQVSGAGLALFSAKSLVLASRAWLDYDALLRGRERVSVISGAGSPRRAYASLTAAARSEAAALLLSSHRSAECTLLLRYRRKARTLHLTLERLPKTQDKRVLAVAVDSSGVIGMDLEPHETRDALMKGERLRMLGTLAASVAHDLGTTLRAANLYLEPMRKDEVTRALHGPALANLSSALQIASETVSRLHSFARAGQVTTGTVDLPAILRDAIKLARFTHRDGSRIDIALDLRELPPVPGTSNELSHLFVNLLINAADAMPAGGRINLRGRRVGRSVVVTVADQGIGIPHSDQRRLFEPFFSTKGNSGTGLGLWLANSTMQRLGGSITVESEPGEGTTFRLVFPALATSRARADGALRAAFAPPPRSPAAAGRRGRGEPGARRRARAPRSARRS